MYDLIRALGVQALANALKENSTLTRLDLAPNRLGAQEELISFNTLMESQFEPAGPNRFTLVHTENIITGNNRLKKHRQLTLLDLASLSMSEAAEGSVDDEAHMAIWNSNQEIRKNTKRMMREIAEFMASHFVERQVLPEMV